MSRKAVQTELKKCTVSAKSHSQRLDVLCKINMGYDETTKNYNKKNNQKDEILHIENSRTGINIETMTISI